MPTLGDRLKYLRNSSNLTMNELGKQLNVDLTTLFSYELNESVPTQEILDKYSTIFCTSVEWILGMEENKLLIRAILDKNE